ncbi:spherulin-1A [Amylocarpus encephaloides]|uniref:Spherulin-1A n=1 Tax=Amylocarpus encephaloides TaxID=45428 RepID=A0A9P7YD32_9HELO|nr:spherulin-1A [Amylocarpus encephaloides]
MAIQTLLLLLAATTSTLAAPSPNPPNSTTYPLPPPTVPSGLPSSCTAETLPNPTLFSALTLAPNAVDRFNLLSDNDLVYNFADPCRKFGVAKGLGGNVTRADHATFPALTTQRGSLAIGFLGPCGFNTPHVHPRAAELNLVIEGQLFAQSVTENGARTISHTLKKYEMTVFPMGAVHTEFNPLCTPSVFVASFPDEDPGVGQIAQEYFGLNKEIVTGSAGGEVSIEGKDVDAFRGLIPDNVAKGVDSCLVKCGIAKR